MTITSSVNPETVQVGKWICLQSIRHFGITDAVRKVERVAGQRVYFLNPKSGEKFRSMKTIEFVCDTESEALEVLAISDSQFAAFQDVKRVHADKLIALLCR
jgi:hypothetical protein